MTVNIHIQPLHEIITLEKGKPPAQSNYNGNREECYLSPDYLRGKAEAELIKPATNAVRVLDGETIVLWDGSNAGEIFRARNGILASTMMRVRHNTDYESEYFYYALKSWEGYLKGQTSGSGVPHVDKEILGNLKLFNCEKTEQSKIAEILSTVDRAIEQTEGLIAKQQRIKTGLMQDILTRGIDEHGNLRSEETHEFKDSPVGRIPVEWEVLTTGEVTKSLVPGRDKPELDRGGVPWITIPDLIELYISTAKSGLSLSQQSIRAANARLMPTGTVLMSCVGEFGIAAIVEVDVVANQQLHGFVCSDRIMREWLAFQIINAGYRIDKMTTQTTIKYLNKSGCESILISLPSLREQKKAIAVLMNIQNISSQYEAGLVKLRSLKTALMQDLLTGKVRVKVDTEATDV